MAAIRVFIVDDRDDVRTSLAEYLESCDDFQVVGVAASGEEALQELHQGGGDAVDIVVMDVNMPGISGFDATKELHHVKPETPIVLCSLNDSAENRHQARAVGASAFVSKFDAVDELPLVLRALSQGYHPPPRLSA